jgi:hypothetical protein
MKSIFRSTVQIFFKIGRYGHKKIRNFSLISKDEILLKRKNAPKKL